MRRILNSRVTIFPQFLTSYISYFCTLIASSPTYTCIHKYLTLPKLTLYESCWHSCLCNGWYFLILWSFRPYCCSFHDTLSERYWSNLLSHSFWTMGTPNRVPFNRFNIPYGFLPVTCLVTKKQQQHCDHIWSCWDGEFSFRLVYHRLHSVYTYQRKFRCVQDKVNHILKSILTNMGFLVRLLTGWQLWCVFTPWVTWILTFGTTNPRTM